MDDMQNLLPMFSPFKINRHSNNFPDYFLCLWNRSVSYRWPNMRVSCFQLYIPSYGQWMRPTLKLWILVHVMLAVSGFIWWAWWDFLVMMLEFVHLNGRVVAKSLEVYHSLYVCVYHFTKIKLQFYFCFMSIHH